MAYSYPEWEDVVQGYLISLYRRFRRPVSAGIVYAEMLLDIPEAKWSLEDVEEALESLKGKELIAKIGRGYKPLVREEALRQQMAMEEVRPFTREPFETQEAHLDKIWKGDIRDLQLPTFGNEYGLYPVCQFNEEKPWRGLTKDE